MPGFPTQIVGTPHSPGESPALRENLPTLFVAEGYDGVNAGGAAGGDEAGQQGDEREQGGDTGESERGRGADAEQQAGQEARDRPGGGNSPCQSERPHTGRAP